MDQIIESRLSEWSNNIIRQYSSNFLETNVRGRAFLRISIPALVHQLFSAGWRLLVTFYMFQTVASIHEIKESRYRPPEFSERLSPIPHLPPHYAKAVYVCFADI